jgi:chromosome segregation ATPase
MGKSLIDKDLQIQKLKNLQNDFEAEKKQHELSINDLKQNTKQKINNLNETIRQKEDLINELNEELTRFKSNLSKEMQLNAKQIVNNDVTFNELKIMVKNLKSELEARLRDMQKLKQSLQDSIEREDKLERDRQQLELDWQKKYEKLEKCKINESDEFLQKLNESREQALAQIKHLEEKLNYKENLINAMKSANPSVG